MLPTLIVEFTVRLGYAIFAVATLSFLGAGLEAGSPDWGTQVADYLNERATADATPVVINLASEEYFKVVDRKALKPRVVTCVFEERKGDQYKVVSFFAKRARGLMVRHAVERGAETVDDLKTFDREGYAYVPAASEPDRLVFRRDAQR